MMQMDFQTWRRAGAAIGLSASLALAGAAAAGELSRGESQQVATSDIQPPLPAGAWSGAVEEPGGQIKRYTLLVRFAEGPGAQAADVLYPELGCSGRWSQRADGRAGGWSFDETITVNREGCTAGGRVDIAPRADGGLDWEWRLPDDGKLIATATLRADPVGR